jgi:O-methyltransferase
MWAVCSGFCIIDDYWSFDDCKRAVDEYRAEKNITEQIVRIDGLSCFWRKMKK